MDLDIAKKRFENHVATFTDYGNIKILDFKRPDSSEYRIRFLFEEDFYRLHITGDLGDLIACNYCNMCWDKFERDYANNSGYFEEKIDTMSKDLYRYDNEKARKELEEKFSEFYIPPNPFFSDEEIKENAINDIMDDFGENGIGSRGYDELQKFDPDCFDYISDIGKENTGILELYMLAFRLAKQHLRQEGKM